MSSSAWTVSAWVYATASSASGNVMIAGKVFSTKIPFALGYGNSALIATNKVWAGLYNGTGWFAATDQIGTLPLFRWVHLVGILRASPNNFELYRDGVVAGAGPNGSGPVTDEATAIRVGSRWDSTATADTFPGTIADPAVWTGRALSPGDIRQLAAGASPLLFEPDHYWPLAGLASKEPDVGLATRLPLTVGATAPLVDRDPPAFQTRARTKPSAFTVPFFFAGNAPITISAPAASATFSAPAPKLGRMSITAPAASATFSAPAPSANRVRIVAPVASSTMAAPAPTLKETVRPAAATVAFSIARPGVVLDGFKVIVNPAATAAFSAPSPSILLGSGVGAIPSTTVRAGTDWRLVLCDLNGRPITLLSALARNKQVVAQLNRPMETSFVVAADDPRVNSLHTDGLPYLWPGARTMKWYRKEGRNWVLRFAGYVWSINPAERDADSSVVDIAVTCYDPFQRLMKRLCRDASGSYATTVSFASTPGATIAKTLVDRSILYGGAVGIATSGSFAAATTPQTVTYDQTFVAQALIDLTNTMTLDLSFDPVDRTDGILASMGAVAKRGTDRPAVIFGYDAIPHSALGFNRSLSMDEFANDITLYSGQTRSGKKLLSAHRSSATSKSTYGGYEDAQVLTGITAQPFLDTIADTEIQYRKNPRDLVAVRPVPERSPSLWLDWWLGDRVFVEWSSSTGAAGSGYQRAYGVRLDIDDQGFETIDELLVSADAESG